MQIENLFLFLAYFSYNILNKLPFIFVYDKKRSIISVVARVSSGYRYLHHFSKSS